jgi:hypothetical protein
MNEVLINYYYLHKAYDENFYFISFKRCYNNFEII